MNTLIAKAQLGDRTEQHIILRPAVQT